jgi:hypothetical protein
VVLGARGEHELAGRLGGGGDALGRMFGVVDPPARVEVLDRAATARAASSGSGPYPFSRSTDTGSSVIAASAAVWAMTSSSVTSPSRRPSVKANPELVVASALNPSCSSTFAEPASQGFGITNGSPACSR